MPFPSSSFPTTVTVILTLLVFLFQRYFMAFAPQPSKKPLSLPTSPTPRTSPTTRASSSTSVDIGNSRKSKRLPDVPGSSGAGAGVSPTIGRKPSGGMKAAAAGGGGTLARSKSSTALSTTSTETGTLTKKPSSSRLVSGPRPPSSSGRKPTSPTSPSVSTPSTSTPLSPPNTTTTTAPKAKSPSSPSTSPSSSRPPPPTTPKPNPKPRAKRAPSLASPSTSSVKEKPAPLSFVAGSGGGGARGTPTRPVSSPNAATEFQFSVAQVSPGPAHSQSYSYSLTRSERRYTPSPSPRAEHEHEHEQYITIPPPSYTLSPSPSASASASGYAFQSSSSLPSSSHMHTHLHQQHPASPSRLIIPSSSSHSSSPRTPYSISNSNSISNSDNEDDDYEDTYVPSPRGVNVSMKRLLSKPAPMVMASPVSGSESERGLGYAGLVRERSVSLVTRGRGRKGVAETARAVGSRSDGEVGGRVRTRVRSDVEKDKDTGFALDLGLNGALFGESSLPNLHLGVGIGVLDTPQLPLDDHSGRPAPPPLPPKNILRKQSTTSPSSPSSPSASSRPTTSPSTTKRPAAPAGARPAPPPLRRRGSSSGVSSSTSASASAHCSPSSPMPVQGGAPASTPIYARMMKNEHHPNQHHNPNPNQQHHHHHSSGNSLHPDASSSHSHSHTRRPDPSKLASASASAPGSRSGSVTASRSNYTHRSVSVVSPLPLQLPIGASTSSPSRPSPHSAGVPPPPVVPSHGGSARVPYGTVSSNALTPASALVEAYKKQEKERMDSEMGASANASAAHVDREGEEKIPVSTNPNDTPDPTPLRGSFYASTASANTSISALEFLNRGASEWDESVGRGVGFELIAKLHSGNVEASGDDQHQHQRQRQQEPRRPATSPTSPTLSTLNQARSTFTQREREGKPLPSAPRSPPDSPSDDPADPTPYYTVFGSASDYTAFRSSLYAEGGSRTVFATATATATTSSSASTALASSTGRVVAVGGPWDGSVWAAGPKEEKEKGNRAGGLGRTLSRKVSSRWKREEPAARGRTSLQRQRSGERDLPPAFPPPPPSSGGHPRRKSWRLSVDGLVGGDGVGGLARGSGPPSHPSGVMSDTGHMNSVAVVSDVEDYGIATDRRPLHNNKPRQSEPIPATTGAGKKIWKLVKRISTGGLRDKYYQADEAPPVPPIPKGFEGRSNGSSPMQLGSTPSSPSPDLTPPPPPPPPQGGMLAKILPSRSSTSSASAPPSRHASASYGALKPVPLSSSPSSINPTPNPRPSTTTRSSSPMSSDVASSRFFHRTQSAHSSTSSLNEYLPPPMPTSPMALGKHIYPPSEFNGTSPSPTSNPNTKRPSPGHHLPLPPSQARMLDDEWSIANTPAVELPSLPFPPRRRAPPPSGLVLKPGRSTDDDDSDSPAIPSFSTAGAINAFPFRSPSLSSSSRKRGSASASATPAASPSRRDSSNTYVPRRLSRSAQRTTVQSRVTSLDVPRSPAPTVRAGESPYDPKRRSSGGFSTSTARPTTNQAANASSSTKMKFRELGDSERHVLTEKEKADKWNDLLERSAKAGGTLHLSGDMLASDRLSMASELV